MTNSLLLYGARPTPLKSRAALLVLSDLHSGNKFGLCPRGVVLYDETPYGQRVPYIPRLTAFQEMLLTLLEGRIIPEAASLAGDDPLHLIVLGDPTHGVKYPEQIMTTRMADQIIISVSVLEYVISRLPQIKSVRLVFGTGVHEFGEGSATLLIAKILKDRFPDLDIEAIYHGRIEYSGAETDFSHHGPGKGKRIWLDGNEARFYLRDICLRAVAKGQYPPRLVLRGHTHVLVSEVLTLDLVDGLFESRIIVCPPMCGMGDHARKVMSSPGGVTVGAVLEEIIDGIAQTPKVICESLDIRTKETL